MARSPFSMLMGRLRHESDGFSLVEVVVAMGVILLSLTMVATSAIVGFKGAATARQRQAATGIADRAVEQVRGLPFSSITEGMRDSDLTGDSNIVTCSGVYKFGSCSGETIVHASAASTPPLYPHRTTMGPPAYPDTFTRSVYLTYANGNTSVYRLTIEITWTSGGRTSSIQTQTLLSQQQGSGDSSTQVSSGGTTASYFGSGSVSPGSVVVKPNANVYGGVGISGLTTSVWNLTDSVWQRMYSLDANIAQGQVAKVDGQSTMTAAEKSIGGTVTPSGGSSTYSTADDDATTTDVATSSAPTSISQSGPSLTLTGSGNALTLNQYSQTTTTTTTTSTIVKRSSSYATSTDGSITITAPAGMIATDLLMAQLSYQGTCMATPSGWTLIRCDTKDTSGSAPRISSSIFWQVADAADVSAGSFSFTTGGTSGTVGGIIAYAGGDGSTPIDASNAATGASTTATTSPLGVNVSNARLVTFFSAYGNTTITPTDPGSAATDWAQDWSTKGGSPHPYYLTNTPALSSTPGTGTLASGSTTINCNTSITWCTAKTFATTVNTDLKSGSNPWTLEVNITSADPASEYEYRFYLVHQDSTGVQKAGTSPSGYSTIFTGTGTKSYTFTWDPGTWATGDKLAVVWEHHKIGGNGNKASVMATTNASHVDAPAADPLVAAGAAASGNKMPRGQGVLASGWSATLSQSALWVAQMVSIRPGSSTTTTTTNDSSTYGTESGSTVSTVAAAASPVCGSPSQTDGKPCAYATQTYPVPTGVDNTFLGTTVDFTNSVNGYSGLGTCRLYKFGPPTSSPTNYAYGRRMTSSGNERIREDVKRYYGMHIFGQMCSGSGTTPNNWPGYFVKFDPGTSAAQATTEAGAVAAPTTSATTAGTIYVWNGNGTTSFAVPTSGTWSTNPTSVNWTSNQGYQYQMTATLGSGQTYTTSSSTTAGNEAKAVVGSPVIGSFTYKITDTSTNRVLVDVTVSVDLGALVSNSKYTSAAA